MTPIDTLIDHFLTALRAAFPYLRIAAAVKTRDDGERAAQRL